MGELGELLGSVVYLDTNIVVYAVEGYEVHARPIKSILQALTEESLVAVTSDLTLAEVLVKPKRENNQQLEEAYRQVLTPTKVWRNSPITREILESAAQLRAATSLKLPDAIHFATALAEGCDSFVTNHERFSNIPGIKVVLLSQLSGINRE